MDAAQTTSSLLPTLCLIGIVVGIVGVVVPVLPGLLLCWASVLVWALFADVGWGRWLVLGLCTLWTALGIVIKYAWPGRKLKNAGIPTGTLLVGIALGLVGMFVVPVVGLLLGFVLGVWLAEAARLGGLRTAWPSTRAALLGAGLSVLVELTAAMLVLGTYIIALLTT